jgi:hypothetical protein
MARLAVNHTVKMPQFVPDRSENPPKHFTHSRLMCRAARHRHPWPIRCPSEWGGRHAPNSGPRS